MGISSTAFGVAKVLRNHAPLVGILRNHADEALGQLGQDEPASERRWSHCSAPLSYFGWMSLGNSLRFSGGDSFEPRYQRYKGLGGEGSLRGALPPGFAILRSGFGVEG